MQAGQRLGKYQVIEKVGQGGMAVVYRGHDTSLRREVAIKVLHSHLAEHTEARERFGREAHAVAKLRHENILEIHDFSGLDSDETYIVTEFIDGCTLREFVADHRLHFPEIGALIVAQVCSALAHAHSLGVLHRDVKPENIMIRKDGVIKLTDFGIAQMIDLQRMTLTGQLLGSPAYMAPEHVQGGVLDFRTDVFALGIVLYQLVTHQLPFNGKNPHEILKKIADCDYTDPARLSPRVGRELGAIIKKALQKDPEDRFRNISLMRQALLSYLDDSGLSSGESELERFFGAPAAYQMALEKRLVDHLRERAQALPARERNAALELYNRVLSIDEHNEEVLAIIAQSDTRRRNLSIVGALLGALALVALAFVAQRNIAARAPSASAIDAGPLGIGNRVADAARPTARPTIADAIDASQSSASLADAREEDAANNAAKDAGAAVPRSVPSHGRGRQGLGRRKQPGTPATPASVSSVQTRHVKLRVSPKHSEYRIDKSPWMAMRAGGAEFDLGPGEHSIGARNPECCQEMQRSFSENSNATSIVMSLRYLPGQVTPVCGTAGIRVSLDGKTVRLGRPATIPIHRLTGTEVVKLEFFSNDRVDEHRVIVSATKNERVRCRF